MERRIRGGPLRLNPQLIFIQRDEFVRMSQQALVTTPGNFGNINAYTFAFRYYPFMFSRAGFAYHAEYSLVRNRARRRSLPPS